jgi:hypothetical protein
MPLLQIIRQDSPSAGPVQALTRRAEPVLQHNGSPASKTSHDITTGCR